MLTTAKTKESTTLTAVKVTDCQSLKSALANTPEAAAASFLRGIDSPSLFSRHQLKGFFKNAQALNALLCKQSSESKDKVELSATQQKAIIEVLGADGLVDILKKELKGDDGQALSETQKLCVILNNVSDEVQWHILSKLDGRLTKKRIKTLSDFALIFSKLSPSRYGNFIGYVVQQERISQEKTKVLTDALAVNIPGLLNVLLFHVPIENEEALFSVLKLEDRQQTLLSDVKKVVVNVPPQKSYVFLSYIKRLLRTSNQTVNDLLKEVTPYYEVLNIPQTCKQKEVQVAYAKHLIQFQFPTDYNRLAVHQNAKSAIVDEAYKKLCLAFHPDKNEGDEVAATQFKAITAAYERLGGTAAYQANKTSGVVSEEKVITLDDLINRIQAIDVDELPAYLRSLTSKSLLSRSTLLSRIINDVTALNKLFKQINPVKHEVLLEYVDVSSMMQTFLVYKPERLPILLEGLSWETQSLIIKKLENKDKLLPLLSKEEDWIGVLSKIPPERYSDFYDYVDQLGRQNFSAGASDAFRKMMHNPQKFTLLMCTVSVDAYYFIKKLINEKHLQSQNEIDHYKQLFMVLAVDRFKLFMRDYAQENCRMPWVSEQFPQKRYADFAKFFDAIVECVAELKNYAGQTVSVDVQDLTLRFVFGLHRPHLSTILTLIPEIDYPIFLTQMIRVVGLDEVARACPENRFGLLLKQVASVSDLLRLREIKPSQIAAVNQKILELVDANVEEYKTIASGRNTQDLTEALLDKVLANVINDTFNGVDKIAQLFELIYKKQILESRQVLSINENTIRQSREAHERCQQEIKEAAESKSLKTSYEEKKHDKSPTEILLEKRMKQLTEHKSTGNKATPAISKVEAILLNDLAVLGLERKLFERHFIRVMRLLRIINVTHPQEALNLFLQLIDHIPIENCVQIITNNSTDRWIKNHKINFARFVNRRPQLLMMLERLSERDPSGGLQDHFLKQFSIAEFAQLINRRHFDDGYQDDLEYLIRLFSAVKEDYRETLWQTIRVYHFRIVINTPENFIRFMAVFQSDAQKIQWIAFVFDRLNANIVANNYIALIAAIEAMRIRLTLNPAGLDPTLTELSKEIIASVILLKSQEISIEERQSLTSLFKIARKSIDHCTDENLKANLSQLIATLPGHTIFWRRLTGWATAFLGVITIFGAVFKACASGGILAPLVMGELKLGTALLEGGLAMLGVSASVTAVVYVGKKIDKTGHMKGSAYATQRFFNHLEQISRSALVPYHPVQGVRR